MPIQLTWTDPKSGKTYQPQLQPPIALGRSFNGMPGMQAGQAVSRIVLDDETVQGFHALLELRNDEIWLNSQAESRVNGAIVTEELLQQGDRIQIGPFELKLILAEDISDSVQPMESNADPAPLAGLAQVAAELPGQVAEAMGKATEEWVCDRKVGFLFKRRCDRTTALGCPYCRDGQIDHDPYVYDYELYPGYGTYRPGNWGYEYYRDRAYYCYNRESRNVDFTEADAASFENESDTDYEMNFGAS